MEILAAATSMLTKTSAAGFAATSVVDAANEIDIVLGGQQ